MNWFDDAFLPGGYGMGPFPFEYAELEAYSRVMKRDLRTWEFDLLREMSEAYCHEYALREKRKAEMPQGMKQIDMKNPEAIKALFSKQGGRKKSKGDK